MTEQDDVPGLLQACREGFEGVGAAEAQSAAALSALEQWLTDPVFTVYRPQLQALIEEGRWAVLLDSFYQVIPFGTGGRRGAVGVGPNRFNPWTLDDERDAQAALKHRFFTVTQRRIIRTRFHAGTGAAVHRSPIIGAEHNIGIVDQLMPWVARIIGRFEEGDQLADLPVETVDHRGIVGIYLPLGLV